MNQKDFVSSLNNYIVLYALLPRAEICVNPHCKHIGEQEDYEFADMPARVKTYTGDLLAVSVDPPAIYGLVQFEGGGRFVADFTDCALDDVYVGSDFLMEQLDMQNILRRVKARVQKEMEAMVSKRSWQGVKVETAVREGDPADEILRFAEERKAGLIVLGTHARSGLEHMFLGRSVRRVARNSPIPVLTVRGEAGPGGKRK